MSFTLVIFISNLHMFSLGNYMVFEYKGWKLYCRDVALKTGKIQRIYFFSKNEPKSGTPCDLPKGYRVIEAKTKGSGMPYITKH